MERGLQRERDKETEMQRYESWREFVLDATKNILVRLGGLALELCYFESRQARPE